MNKEEVIAFFDRLAPDWDAGTVTDMQKLKLILDTAGIKEGAAVLDVACGTGVLIPLYLERGVACVTGVDISGEMIRLARAKFTDPRVQLICGDMETQPPLGQHDCCVIYNAFPHFASPRLLLAAAGRWLRPGGRLTVAHGMGLAALERHHQNVKSVSRRMLTENELADLMSAGFIVDTALADEDIYLVSGCKRC